MTSPADTSPFPALTSGHAHEADLDACLDLINTLEHTDGIPDERIGSVDAAVSYFASRGLAHEDALRAQAGLHPEGWLERVRAGRAALRAVWDAAVEGHTVAGDAVDTLNEVLGHAPHVTLRATLAGVAVDHRHEDDVLGEALARVAEPLVAAIAAGDTARFRICANDGCREAFEDTSRGGRRRWCEMSSCGNRAKVRRFRSRHRDDDGPGAAREPDADRVPVREAGPEPREP